MDLVEKYENIGLKPCETKETQKWKHASNKDIAKKLLQYHIYLSELTNRHFSLNVYLICKRHYNQAIIKNQFYQYLIGSV